MPIVIESEPAFEAELLDLSLSRDQERRVLALQWEVKLVNRSTGAFSVMRGGDLSPDLQAHLLEFKAMLEQHAGERFFDTTNEH